MKLKYILIIAIALFSLSLTTSCSQEAEKTEEELFDEMRREVRQEIVGTWYCSIQTYYDRVELAFDFNEDGTAKFIDIFANYSSLSIGAGEGYWGIDLDLATIYFSSKSGGNLTLTYDRENKQILVPIKGVSKPLVFTKSGKQY